MPRFTCNHPTTSLIKHITLSGKVLAFDYLGVLDTDEEGAALIRAHPLYGRLILEGDESAAAHVVARAFQAPREVVLPPAAQERRKRSAPRGLEAVAVEVECAVCRERFIPRSLNGGRRLYCSGKCRDRAYRAKRGAKPRWYVKLLQEPSLSSIDDILARLSSPRPAATEPDIRCREKNPFVSAHCHDKIAPYTNLSGVWKGSRSG